MARPPPLLPLLAAAQRLYEEHKALSYPRTGSRHLSTEVAATLGASRLRTFLHINLRLTLPGMGIGCVFVFLASLADFATPKLIGGLVTSIGELIRDNVTFVNLPNASAISALVVVIALAVLVLTFRLAHVEQIFE